MLHPLNIYSTQCTICSTLEYNTYMPGTWCYFYLYPSQHYKLLWLAQFFKRKRKKVLHTYLLIYVIKRWNCRLCTTYKVWGFTYSKTKLWWNNALENDNFLGKYGFFLKSDFNREGIKMAKKFKTKSFGNLEVPSTRHVKGSG